MHTVAASLSYRVSTKHKCRTELFIKVPRDERNGCGVHAVRLETLPSRAKYTVILVGQRAAEVLPLNSSRLCSQWMEGINVKGLPRRSSLTTRLHSLGSLNPMDTALIFSNPVIEQANLFDKAIDTECVPISVTPWHSPSWLKV